MGVSQGVCNLRFVEQSDGLVVWSIFDGPGI